MMSAPCGAFPPAKRYTLTACFLVEVHKTILDHIVALHDQLLTKKMREAKMPLKNATARSAGSIGAGLLKLIATGETLLDPMRSPETTLAALLHELDAAELRAAVAICTERHTWKNAAKSMPCARYPGLTAVSPGVLRLPLPKANPAVDAIVKGLDLVRQLDAGTLKTLPLCSPTAFVPGRY